MSLSRARSAIVARAKGWVSSGPCHPTAEELRDFFVDAQCEQFPTLEQAQKSLRTLDTGCYVGQPVKKKTSSHLVTPIKQWCGIFACSILANSLVDVKWSLAKGHPVAGPRAKGFQVYWNNKGMKPGDIAVIHAHEHHFIITEIDYQTKVMRSVDGNQSGNTIRAVTTRSISQVYAHYSFAD